MCETGWVGLVGKKEGKKHRQRSEKGGGGGARRGGSRDAGLVKAFS